MDFADVNAKWVVWKRTATDEEKAGLQAEGVVATERHRVGAEGGAYGYSATEVAHRNEKNVCERRG